MSCKDKCGYPINPAPFAPGDCGPGHCGLRPPMPPRPPMKPGCPPSQYIGSRYVPIFADPIEWDINRAYESLTIATYNGESYTSKCNVGPGIDITNTRYWAKTGAYNAQLEQCKESVKDLSSQVTGFAADNTEFREKITQFEKDNAEMKNTVAEDKARVDALAERVATAETEIDGLQATTTQHTKELADLHAKDEDLQRQITSNDNDIAALQAKDLEHDGRLDGIDTKLKSHDASIAQNTSDIAKNTKNIQDNAANIAINAHKIADHAEKLTDHEARLTAQHEEITDNHTAIERNTSDIAGLRSDLTEDEAKIESNRDAIAHIQEKDVQQDGRLDALEKRATTAEGRLDGLDTKTDETNTKLSEEIDRAKAAEVANGKLIAANAAELADHAEELADHEERITALETDNAKNKTDITDIKAKDVQQDTAISGNTDSIQHLESDKADKTALGDYVTKTAFNADQKRQDDIVGDWATAHPGQTIAECATSQETELSEHAGQIAQLETDKADKSEIPDVSKFWVKPSDIIHVPFMGFSDRYNQSERRFSGFGSYTGFMAAPPCPPGKKYIAKISVDSLYAIPYAGGAGTRFPNSDTWELHNPTVFQPAANGGFGVAISNFDIRLSSLASEDDQAKAAALSNNTIALIQGNISYILTDV